VQVIMLVVAKCDRLAAVPQTLLAFELFLQNTRSSRVVANKVRPLNVSKRTCRGWMSMCAAVRTATTVLIDGPGGVGGPGGGP
jgi:hypothetical protein